MCRMVDCETCGAPTWAGCGMHIDTALAAVPVDKRCACKARTQEEQAAKK